MKNHPLITNQSVLFRGLRLEVDKHKLRSYSALCCLSVCLNSSDKALNETMKVVNIVCDNVRRTLSRFLHIESNARKPGANSNWKNKLKTLGDTLDGFYPKLSKSIETFQSFLDEVSVNEGDGTMDGLMDALFIRFKNRQRPFGTNATKGEVTKTPSLGLFWRNTEYFLKI